MICFSSTVLAQPSLPKDWAGQWWLGVLNGVLPINITFQMTEGGSVEAAVYSPMQSTDPVPLSDCGFKNDTLILKSKASSMTMTLCWNASDKSFSGTFKQGIMKTDISFLPTEGLYQSERSQSVGHTDSYRSKEFSLKRKKEGVTITGTITAPLQKGKYPAVVLVNGSGQQDRDCTVAGHKLFAVLADYLTRQGVVVLRYDDRGVGGSVGEVQNATTCDFADDAEAVFDYLRKQPFVDKKKMGIIGHSEGGIIAPLVAVRNNKVAFVIMMAGPATSGAQVFYDQNQQILSLQGIADRLIQKRIAFMNQIFLMDADSVNLSSIRNAIKQHGEGLSDSERELVGLRRSDAVLWNQQMSMPWMQTFIKINPSQYLPELKCPLLAINGERDIQVVPSNLIQVKQLVPHADTVAYPQLNHLFQHCETGSPDEYFLIDETISEEVMSDMCTWIKKVTQTMY